MYQSLSQTYRDTYHIYRAMKAGWAERPDMICDWPTLRNQLLLQWNNLTSAEVDKAGPDRHRLALLIQRKNGIPADMVENYLHNFERTLPLVR
jgi:hypothetical protein